MASPKSDLKQKLIFGKTAAGELIAVLVDADGKLETI